ncbi:UNVERIFIED_CONTAM: hypothetical protein H355_009915 [Colinus virginianus]|nr:hypothetical protein H355_009915 [Colinus virginianus]
MTPLRENACGGPSTPSPPAIRINELGLVGSGTIRFVELEGQPGASLAGLILLIFEGQGGKVQRSIPLRGSLGASGLLLLGSGSGKTELTFEDLSAASEGSSAIALYSTSLIPGVMKATSENLVDAVVFTCRPSTVGGPLDFLGPLYAVPCGDDRSVSLSRCPSGDASGELQFAVSEPTPGLQNSCSQDTFTVGLDLCFLKPNCSVWILNHGRMLESLRKALVSSLQENCSCGVSELYLQELNMTCADSLVKISGQMRALWPEQKQFMESWRQDLLASPHQFSVDGRVLETSPECIAQRSTSVSSQSSSPASPRGWQIALFVVGALLIVLLLVGLALHYIKRRLQNYTNIELNDCTEMEADF